jgi:hypothetical protein
MLRKGREQSAPLTPVSAQIIHLSGGNQPFLRAPLASHLPVTKDTEMRRIGAIMVVAGAMARQN